MKDDDIFIIIGVLFFGMLIGMLICVGITNLIGMEEWRKESEVRAEAQKEWEATTENKECFANCREQGYMTYISAPGNCVCDTTKMVIIE